MRNALLQTIVGLLLVFVTGTAVQAQTPPGVDQVFRLRVATGADGAVVLNWTIAPGNYLYRDKIAVTTANGAALEVATARGEMKDDPSFGQTEIYRTQAQAVLVAKLQPSVGNIIVTFQGCAERGICYPPTRKIVDPKAISIVSGDAAIESTGPVATNWIDPAPSWAPPQGGSTDNAPVQAGLQGNIAVMLVAFGGLGLLLAFTPCVFPMIPILSGMLAQSGERLTARRGFVLSGIFVLAMALAYAMLGVVVAWSGQNLQAALQTPLALGLMGMVFVALALSMFGLYDLQLPQFVRNRLAGKGPRQSGSLAGAAIMGFGSALIVGPCVTPPLAAALLYVAQTGDIARGASALFALGLGMGLPLIAIGTFGAGVLPRSGPWLRHVKHVFGFCFVGLAIWILSRILPEWIVPLLWTVMAGAIAVYLAVLVIARTQRGPRALAAVAGVLFAGLVLALGAFGGSSGLSQGLVGILTSPSVVAANAVEFETVKTTHALDEAIATATRRGRRVLLDFSAEWCVECKLMDRTVFSDPAVRERLRDFALIRADATDYNDDSRSLMKRFGVVGPPTVIFFGAHDGREAAGTRIVGPIDSTTFLDQLNRLPAA